MLKRTAGDVEAGKALYKDAEFFTFCSAVVSRKVMEADIGDIAYCPYVVFAYEAEKPGNGRRRAPDAAGRAVSAIRSTHCWARSSDLPPKACDTGPRGWTPAARICPTKPMPDAGGVFFRPIAAMRLGSESSLTHPCRSSVRSCHLRGGELFGQRQRRPVAGQAAFADLPERPIDGLS
jgi:hypothetical protein